ncbi:classical arabinogalactan protein 9-like [Penaeus chinensis]|uniref:classical arabinogalactan protein 9-like n=1 Tax=Penaeus chinensis TaxID=139456 RepID=UPI001FB7B3F0|nr:classical arabinogalactan protein 9-like [Penaeus chinensis]
MPSTGKLAPPSCPATEPTDARGPATSRVLRSQRENGTSPSDVKTQLPVADFNSPAPSSKLPCTPPPSSSPPRPRDPPEIVLLPLALDLPLAPASKPALATALGLGPALNSPSPTPSLRPSLPSLPIRRPSPRSSPTPSPIRRPTTTLTTIPKLLSTSHRPYPSPQARVTRTPLTSTIP